VTIGASDPEHRRSSNLQLEHAARFGRGALRRCVHETAVVRHDYEDRVSLNTASGDFALYANTFGVDNTASGYAALYENTTGYSDTAFGWYALFNNTTGLDNTAVGNLAGNGNTTGTDNTFIGSYADANDENYINRHSPDSGTDQGHGLAFGPPGHKCRPGRMPWRAKSEDCRARGAGTGAFAFVEADHTV
jgi:hypothetical protein